MDTTSAVCLIAKNEERAIAEWLAYQRVIGFDRVYVYDNGSTDETSSIVKWIASKDPAIEYRAWPDMPGRRPQISAYNDVLQRSSEEWIAFFDTDEFLVLHEHPTVNQLLSSMPPDAGAIAVNWLLFGSNNHVTAGPELVVDRFKMCAVPQYAKNRFCKSIVRRNFVDTMLVHTATLRRGRYVNASGQSVVIENEAKTEHIRFDIAQLNHYAVKSREEFLVKKSRGHSSRAPDEQGKWNHFGDDDLFWRAHDANHRDNNDILARRDRLVEKLESWGLNDYSSFKALG
jgi:glycosyltransferase involved in cell wall biosynthesis